MLFYGSTDIVNFRGASEALLTNHAIKQNYFAPILSALAIPRLLEDLYGLPFSFGFKALPILAELGIGYFIYRFSLTFTTSTKAKLITIFYLLHPINLYISVFHGQLDSVAMLLILMSIYLLTTKNRIIYTVTAALFFSLAIGLKVFPILLIPLLFSLRQISWSTKLKFIFLTLLFLALPAFPSLPNLDRFAEYFSYPLSYRSYGMLGLDGILSRASHSFQMLYHHYLLVIILTILGLSAAIAYFRRLDPFFALLLSIVGLLAFSTSLAPQYLVWLVPLIFLTRSVRAIKLSYPLCLFLPLFYIFISNNSGTFAALIPFNFLTPDFNFYNYWLAPLMHFFEINLRWHAIGYILLIWYFSLLRSSQNTSPTRPPKYVISKISVSLITVGVLIGHMIPLIFTYIGQHYPALSYDLKHIYASTLGQQTHMYYGFNFTRSITIPAALRLNTIYIDGGSHLSVSVNQHPPLYYYGNQHWEYHGGWRNALTSLPIKLDPSIDNHLVITSNMSTIRPEYLINIFTKPLAATPELPPKIEPLGNTCTSGFSGTDCHFIGPQNTSWHFSIVEILILLTIVQGLLFHRLKSTWNLSATH